MKSPTEKVFYSSPMSSLAVSVDGYRIEPLGPKTWDAFADLAERHNYPHDLPAGKKTSASFLYNATRSMYEQLGFSYERPKGKGNCVMSQIIPASEPATWSG
jgi:hypothetical protein